MLPDGAELAAAVVSPLAIVTLATDLGRAGASKSGIELAVGVAGALGVVSALDVVDEVDVADVVGVVGAASGI